MTATPKIWKSLTQVNATDSGPDGVAQADGQIVALKDGGYVVIWADNSGAFNPNGTAVMGQRYNSVGNKVGGEVHLSTGFPGSCVPARGHAPGRRKPRGRVRQRDQRRQRYLRAHFQSFAYRWQD